MRQSRFAPEFVEIMPERFEEGVLYISMVYAVAIHLCACGCGEEVVTPLSPTDWQLFFDGESISLKPSIGNWSFKCRSHYWIRANAIRWSYSMTKQEIEEGRARDRKAKEWYFGSDISAESDDMHDGDGLISAIKGWFRKSRKQ